MIAPRLIRSQTPIYLAVCALLCAGSAGCVERQMTLVTEPSGAVAYYNGENVGTTPTTFHFTYYQPADLRFEKDGCKTLRVVQPVKAPAYQRFPLDFFAEVLWPFTVCDEHTFRYTLEAAEDTTVEALVERADALRSRATAESR